MPSWWGLTKRLTYTSQESCQSVYCCSWSMLKSFLKSNTRIFGMRPCVSQSCSTLPLRSSPGFGTALVACSIPEFAPVSPVDVELGVGFGPGFDVGLDSASGLLPDSVLGLDSVSDSASDSMSDSVLGLVSDWDSGLASESELVLGLASGLVSDSALDLASDLALGLVSG